MCQGLKRVSHFFLELIHLDQKLFIVRVDLCGHRVGFKLLSDQVDLGLKLADLFAYLLRGKFVFEVESLDGRISEFDDHLIPS